MPVGLAMINDVLGISKIALGTLQVGILSFDSLSAILVMFKLCYFLWKISIRQSWECNTPFDLIVRYLLLYSNCSSAKVLLKWPCEIKRNLDSLYYLKACVNFVILFFLLGGTLCKVLREYDIKFICNSVQKVYIFPGKLGYLSQGKCN